MHKDGENPNDYGCLTNWHLTLCAELPPSRLANLRDWVGEEGEGEEEEDVGLVMEAGPAGTSKQNSDFQALPQCEELDIEVTRPPPSVRPLNVATLGWRRGALGWRCRK
jgi:hypothetical protein